jgi:hypothetical protein
VSGALSSLQQAAAANCTIVSYATIEKARICCSAESLLSPFTMS